MAESSKSRKRRKLRNQQRAIAAGTFVPPTTNHTRIDAAQLSRTRGGFKAHPKGAKLYDRRSSTSNFGVDG